MHFQYFGPDHIRDALPYDACIDIMRLAMKRLSADPTDQPLRSISQISPGKLLGVMPGSLSQTGVFGLKVVSVFEGVRDGGRSAHQGLVILFSSDTGSVLCTGDAEEITRIRTAAATAAATDALARKEASRLAVFGCGVQARSHVLALKHVRALSDVVVWGRSHPVAARFADDLASETGLPVRAEADAERAASGADIICTVTAAHEPVLFREWVAPGTHVNAVGSSRPGPTEIDDALVAASRYVADYRRSALAAASEFLNAKAAGIIDDDHIVGEIGEVLSGRIAGRTSADEITLYKSLGHIAQDLSALAHVYAVSST
ncbi:ornithine cyclodeaminase family protein [Pseudorhizobium sp. NPDC055634]